MKVQNTIILALGITIIIILGAVFLQNPQITQTNTENAETEVNLENNETFLINAEKTTKEINGQKIDFFGYNGISPGPLLKVKQESSANISFKNQIGEDTTVHWHGLRLDNEFDGVPGVTQEPIKNGESFLYKLKFPDPGLYWYHPHIREDKQQELGLYGGILVQPTQEDYYNKANKEEVIFLDDIKLSNGQPLFYNDLTDHALMGRFGNVMLTNGKTDYELKMKKGEVVRLFFANAANTRTFNVTIPGTKMKLVGSDGGTFEKEEFVDSIIISPSERYIAEVLFESEGTYEILNKTPVSNYAIGKIIVSNEKSENDFSAGFYSLRENNYLKESVEKYREFFNKEIDAELRLNIRMGHMMNMPHMEETEIEWEDSLGAMNSHMTDALTTWIIQDKKTGKENEEIHFSWKKGDLVKIRLYNDPTSMHPMQHPIHFHGQRFLVLNKDGIANENLVWKDTVLVPKGATIDILLEITNSGKWMAHCHIAEHLESGMMFMFNVA
ncbi:MAG TPA: multicopper oxidase family protein [archaeon]|nr:multicopper oxidase family protein [archaeon]